MRDDVREQVRVLYEYHCSYCGVRESDAGARLTLDHYCPRSSGGTDALDNLVYCCHACNEYKGDFWHEEVSLRLLHPLREDMTAHLAPSEAGRLHGLTARGNLHIERLRLNRPQLIAYRLQRQKEVALQKENQQILRSIETLRQDNEALREQIASRRSSGERR